MPFVSYLNYHHSQREFISKRNSVDELNDSSSKRAVDIVIVPHISAPPDWSLQAPNEPRLWLEKLCLDLETTGWLPSLLLYDHITAQERIDLEKRPSSDGLSSDEINKRYHDFDIGIWAARFVEDLRAERKTSSAPIIFFCHGIGGLIFKKALVKLSNSEGLKSYLDLIRFVVFLATPHHGSEHFSRPDLGKLVVDQGPKPSRLKLGPKLQSQLGVSNHYLEFLDHRFRIASAGIPMRCYSELKRTPNWEFNTPHKIQNDMIVSRFSSRISQSTQWNSFEDSFECDLLTSHYYMVFFIGTHGIYDSLLCRIRELLQPSIREKFGHTGSPLNLLNGALRAAIIYCYDVPVAPEDWRDPANLLKEDEVNPQRSDESSPLRGSTMTIDDFFCQVLKDDIKGHVLDVMNKKAYIGLLERSDTVKDDERLRKGRKRKQERREQGQLQRQGAEGKQTEVDLIHSPTKLNWYHLRYPVGDWVPLLLSAIALKKGIPFLAQEYLTEGLRIGSNNKTLLNRPHWQYPGASLRPYPMTVGPKDHPEIAQMIQMEQFVIYLPYLRWESVRAFRKREEMTQDRILFEKCEDVTCYQPDRDPWHTVIWHYFSSQLAVSLRRSLDQFGYPYLPNTYDRDNDQVVTKLIPLRDKEERNSFWDSVSSAPQGTNASFAHHAQREEHMLVVDTLWMWMLSKDIILTFAPTSNGNVDLKVDDWSVELHDELYIRASTDCFTFVALAVRNCVLGVFKESRTPMTPVLTQYEEYLAHWINTHFESLKHFRKKSWTITEQDVNKDLEGLIELKDVTDELEILDKLFADQLQVLTKMIKEFKKFMPDHAPCIEILGQTITSLKACKEQALGMLRRAEKSQSQCESLIDMKQAESSYSEARSSAEEARVATEQARIVTVFTIVTIVFSPLSFFTSFFAMPPTQSQGVGTSLNSILGVMLPASFVIICAAMLSAYHVQLRQQKFGLQYILRIKRRLEAWVEMFGRRYMQLRQRFSLESIRKNMNLGAKKASSQKVSMVGPLGGLQPLAPEPSSSKNHVTFALAKNEDEYVVQQRPSRSPLPDEELAIGPVADPPISSGAL